MPHRRTLGPKLLGLLAVTVAVLPTAQAAADFSSTPSPSVMTNGPVFAIAQAGGTTFLGGSFTRAGTPTGGGADVGQADGKPNLAFAAPNGAVLAVVSDNAGGWYIGGSFTSVGGVAASGLAHLLASGAVDPNFLPALGAPADLSGPLVDALAFSGSTVYAGGSFTVAGTSLSLAGFSAATGAVGIEPAVAGPVYALALAGGTLYAGGQFQAVGSPGVTRGLLAAFDTTTGLPTSFDPELSGPTTPGIGPPSVRALAIAGTTLYAAGHFATANGSLARTDIAAFDLTTAGTATAFHPTMQTSSTIGALAVGSGTVYAGGNFTTSNGAPANFLAAFDANSGAATASFDAAPDNQIAALAVSGGVVYAAGAITNANIDKPTPVARNHVAAFNAADGSLVTGFDPNLDGNGDAIATSGTRVYVGGSFEFAGANTIYNRVAAVNADGTLDAAFNPNIGGPVSALAATPTTLYVGGRFSTVNGTTSRTNLAAFDTTSGVATAFDAHPNGSVDSLLVSGSTLYAGGAFNTVNLGTPPGTTRNGIAAFDAASGTVNPTFDANIDGTVDALAFSGGSLYAGGDFDSVNGGTPRNLLAKVSATTGVVDASFAPTVGDNAVAALVVSGSTVYAGGSFMPLSGTSGPSFLAGFDSTTGLDDASFNPDVNDQVTSLALTGSTLYAGGSFTQANGDVPSRALAGFDASSGTLDPAFTPGPVPSTVNALGIANGALSVGGEFTSVGASQQTYYAQFAGSTTPPPGPALSVTPTSVAGGASVTASFSGVASPTPEDWVGVFPTGASNAAYVGWFWTSSCTQVPGATGLSAGSCTIAMPATAGTYELRLFANNGDAVLATSATVTDTGSPPAVLSASPTTVAPGGTTSVSWSGVVNPSARDWVGLYQTGAANSQYLTFFYTSSCTQSPTTAAASGSCSFTLPTTPGTYELRLFANDSYNLLATSSAVTVNAPPPPTISASPTSVAPGATVSVSFANVASPSATDWVAVYPVGAPAGQYVDWFYASCTRTPGTPRAAGSCSYSMPTTPGTYDFVLMANNGNTVLATSAAVTVTGAAISVTAAPASVGPGDRVTVSWSGVAPPSGSDWIGLYAAGASNGAYLNFLYDATCTGNPAGSGVSSGSCVFTLPTTDGTYEMRLFANNSFTRLGTSNQVTVTG
jgi:uncharacterized protein YegP (UPF0339 family)